MAIRTFSFNTTLGTRLATFLLLCLLLCARPAVAQSSSTDLSSLSQCSTSCLLEGIGRSGCAPLDTACQCTSNVMKNTVTNCMLSNCTMQDSLDVSRFTAQTCGLSHESQSMRVIVVVSTLFGISVGFVALRVASKLMSRTFCTEDYLLISSMVLAVVPLTTVLYMADLGFGGHVWDLRDGALTQILKLFYISEIIYVASLALTKASLVSMYLRIFWAYVPFKLVCYGALLFILLPSAAIILVTILSCQPVAYFWDRDIPKGTCLDVSALAYANSGFAVAQDVTLIMLPIFMLWGLNMSRKKKVFIGMMFAVGSIGLLATIIRLRTLSVFGSLQDPTFDYIPVVYWTTIELSAGIIASCMPSIRILLERFFKVFQLSVDRSVGSGRPIRLERQRRPTVDVMDADTRESPTSVWKNDVWDGYSQNGLGRMSDLWEGSSLKGLVRTRSDLESRVEVESPIKMTIQTRRDLAWLSSSP